MMGVVDVERGIKQNEDSLNDDKTSSVIINYNDNDVHIDHDNAHDVHIDHGNDGDVNEGDYIGDHGKTSNIQRNYDEQKKPVALSISAYVLVILFGLSSWIVLNGIYSQVPIFGNVLPEKWTIVAKISVIVQISNFIPLFHLAISTLAIPRNWRYQWDTLSICFINIVGILSCFLLGFFWQSTVKINENTTISLGMYILVFFAGAVDCSSSVMYFPFISNYDYKFSSALNIGEGLTGGIAGFLAFIQSPGSSVPRFSVFVMTSIILSSTLCISFASFLIFRYVPIFKRYLRKYHLIQDIDSQSERVALTTKQNSQYDESINHRLQSINYIAKKWNHFNTLRLVLVQFTISLLDNGILISLSPYIFNFYPSLGNQYMSYGINASLILDPISAFVAFLLPLPQNSKKQGNHGDVSKSSSKSLTWHSYLLLASHSIVITGALTQIIVGAVLNPSGHILFKDSKIILLVLVILKVITKSCIAFSKTREFLIAHERLQNMEIEPLNEQQSSLSTPNFLHDSNRETNTTETSDNSQKIIFQNRDTHTNEKYENNHCSHLLRSIEPFRLAGFGIQFGALLGSIMMLIFVTYAPSPPQ